MAVPNARRFSLKHHLAHLPPKTALLRALPPQAEALQLLYQLTGFERLLHEKLDKSGLNELVEVWRNLSTARNASGQRGPDLERME